MVVQQIDRLGASKYVCQSYDGQKHAAAHEGDLQIQSYAFGTLLHVSFRQVAHILFDVLCSFAGHLITDVPVALKPCTQCMQIIIEG